MSPSSNYLFPLAFYYKQRGETRPLQTLLEISSAKYSRSSVTSFTFHPKSKYNPDKFLTRIIFFPVSHNLFLTLFWYLTWISSARQSRCFSYHMPQNSSSLYQLPKSKANSTFLIICYSSTLFPHNLTYNIIIYFFIPNFLSLCEAVELLCFLISPYIHTMYFETSLSLTTISIWCFQRFLSRPLLLLLYIHSQRYLLHANLSHDVKQISMFIFSTTYWAFPLRYPTVTSDFTRSDLNSSSRS